jgi:hypothetical protein
MLDATPILKLYARRRGHALDRENTVEAQREELFKLLRQAAATRFGKDHGFSAIKDVADFQARVPLRRYEDMWRDYWEPVFPRLVDCTWPGTIGCFALSSGTTSGTTKYIPVSDAIGRANSNGAKDMLVHHVRNRPSTRLLAGKNFMLGGSTDLSELAPGIVAGDLSGIVAARLSPWSRAFVYPPRDVALISDWEKKIEALVEGVTHQDIRSISGTPSWLLIFFEKLFARHPERERNLAAFFPDLELIAHGGVNFAPYRPQFEALLQGGRAETREVYAASEGFIASADRGPGEGMRLNADNGLFFEFVPVAEIGASHPTRHWVANFETGIDYAIVVTSCAGLFAYVLGDIVRFVDRAPPRLLVTGRTSYYLSSFGEHLTGDEIEDAVSTAAKTIGASIADFSVGAIFPDAERSRGGHLYIVEFSATPPNADGIRLFANTIDEVLSRRNDDYRAHRSGGFGLEPPRILAVAPGTFEAWMKSRGQLGGQHKVPRVIANAQLFQSLRDFVQG